MEIPLPEASGITFDQRRGTFFIITDRGEIAEVDRDGKILRRKNIEDADFEGITIDPQTELLYAVIEGRDRIVEIDAADFTIQREFATNRKLEGERILKGGKEGFEGIAFVPNSAHLEGGTFWVVNQATGNTGKQEPSAILELELPLRSEASRKNKTLKGRMIGGYVPGIPGLSDIHFDQNTGHLLIISDTDNMFLETTIDGDIVKKKTLPGKHQEGITMGENGSIFIVQDEPDRATLVELVLE